MNKTNKVIWWIGENLAYFEDNNLLLNYDEFVRQIKNNYKTSEETAKIWIKETKEGLIIEGRHYRK